LSAWHEVSDEDLVVEVGRRVEPALAEIYRRHGPALFGLARRVLGSGEGAAEIVQDLMVRLWSSPERFEAARGTLRTYLQTQTHGLAVDVLRSENSRAERQARWTNGFAEQPEFVEELVFQRAVEDRVRAAVTTLTDDERAAVTVAYYGGFTYAEAAVILGQPEGTTKSRIRAGLKKLRAALAEPGQDA